MSLVALPYNKNQIILFYYQATLNYHHKQIITNSIGSKYTELVNGCKVFYIK